MIDDKLYKVGNTYYRLNLIQSISELSVYDNRAIGYINGNEVKWSIIFTHYKPEYRDEKIEKDETYQEYITLLKAFKEKYGLDDEIEN